MLYDLNELKNKIDSYMNGTISKEEIGEWAAKAYHDILTGGYIDKTKIVLYPFLKTLSNIHVKRNDFKDIYPCSEEEVLEIKDILHGEKDFDFQVEISIPEQIYHIDKENSYFNVEKRKQISEVRCAILDCIQNGFESSSIIVDYIRTCPQIQKEQNAMTDILEDCIIRICRGMFDINSNALSKKPPLKLYPLKTRSDYMLQKLIDYLDCYIGKKPFGVLVSYRGGLPDISLI